MFGCETDLVVGCSPNLPTTVHAREALCLLQALHSFIFTTFLSHSRQDITWKGSRSFRFMSCENTTKDHRFLSLAATLPTSSTLSIEQSRVERSGH